MGRFKIYDPKKLVEVLSNPTYAKCLLCEKTLKNIMGNIKRHYEQMHSVHVGANANSSKKSSKQKAGHKKDNKISKTSTDAKNRKDVPPTNKIYDNNTLTTRSISGRYKSILDMESSVICYVSDSDSKLKLLSEDIATNIPEKTINLSLKESPERKVKVENKTEIAPKVETEHARSADNSNVKKIKLDEKSDQINIPSHSYINTFQISSLDSCRPLEFLRCLVETKTQLNIPLKSLQKGCTFQKALQTWKQNFTFTCSSQVIGEQMDRLAKKLQQKIEQMVANRILYLKLDIHAIKDDKIMVVNAQFIDDFEIKIVTLSVLQLLDDDLVTGLKQKILTVLQNYKIDMSSVYSITKDNTKNVRDCLKSNDVGIVQDETTDASQNPQTTAYCHHLCEQFPGHAIHFVACDVIKQLHENISQGRDAVRSLRVKFLELNIKEMPSLDDTTSWFSIYDMMISLLNVRKIVENNKLLSVEVDWLFPNKFTTSFKPIVETASMLQTSRIFVMGDFYREWLLCEIELAELTSSNELAIYLLEAMRKRKNYFFENSSFLAALYLDPRFCYMGSMYLNDKHKEIAIAHLLQIFTKLKETTITKPNIDNINDRYLKLEKHSVSGLKTNVETMTTYETDLNVNYKKVKESLQNLQFESRLPFNTNILNYWRMAKCKSPVVAKIAEIALAAPATQATINRVLKTSLITLFKERKIYESTDVIENILLLTFNQEIVHKISLE